MSLVQALYPSATLFAASLSKRCRPRPYAWQPPGAVFAIVWTFLGITTGITGFKMWDANNREANTAYYALLFCLGTGWYVSQKICKQWFTLLYVASTYAIAQWLYVSLRRINTQKTKDASLWLLPLLGWLLIAFFLALLALIKMYKPY